MFMAFWVYLEILNKYSTISGVITIITQKITHLFGKQKQGLNENLTSYT